MRKVFKDDIEFWAEDGFKSREDYENWVQAWVEDSINEVRQVGRYYLGVDDPTKELNIKIGEQKCGKHLRTI